MELSSSLREGNKIVSLVARGVPICVYIILVLITLERCERRTGGTLVYALDDAYIHMSVAKTLITAHSYGLQPHEFSSPESSIVWPFLVAAGFLVSHSSLAVPLILNVLFSIAAILCLELFLARLEVRPIFRLLGGLLLVWITPLAPLTSLGMEHTGQCASVLVFAGFCMLAWRCDDRVGAHPVALFCAAVVMVLFRFEALFVAFAAGILFAWRRRWNDLAIVLAGAVFPALLFAMWLMSHGHFFLPDSMIIKRPTSIVMNIRTNLEAMELLSPGYMALCSAALLVAMKKKSVTAVGANALVVFTIAIHMVLVRSGSFLRYEAYLLALLIFAVTLTLQDVGAYSVSGKRDRIAVVGSLCVLLLVVGCLLLRRGIDAFQRAPRAAEEIYLQQVQMAKFFDLYYGGRSIALNDVGAVAFLGRARIFDVVGLGAHDVARLRAAGISDANSISRLAAKRDVEAAAVYDRWFSGTPQWTQVGEWVTHPGDETIVLGSKRVLFYGTNPCRADELAAHLRDFQKQLPAGIEVKITPLESNNSGCTNMSPHPANKS